MAGKLPEGLITTSSNLGENIRSADRLDPETLRRLWHGWFASLQKVVLTD